MHTTSTMRWMLLLSFLLSFELSFAQLKKYSISDQEYDPITNMLVLDLNSEILDFDYSPDFQIDYRKISPGGKLVGQVGEMDQSGLFKFSWVDFEPGEYVFQVKKNGRPDHLVAVKVKAPKPMTDISITQNGVNQGEKIKMDYRTPLAAKIHISGGMFYDLPEVSIQGKKLAVEQIDEENLIATIDWRDEQLANLKLGNQKLKIAHEDWGEVYNDIVISGAPPILTGVKNIEYTKKQSQVNFEFSGKLISPNALICTTCPSGDCYVEQNCFLISKISGDNYKVSVGINIPNHVQQTSFDAYIKNGDGQESLTFNVQVTQSTSTLTIKSKNESQGLVSGIPIDVVVENTNGDFELHDFDEYKLLVNDIIPVKFSVNQSISTFQQLFGTIIVPETFQGKDANFTLNKGYKTWNGKADVKGLPQLIKKVGDFYRNQSYNLNYTNTVTGASISTETPGVVIDDQDVSDGVGKISLQSQAPDLVLLRFKIQDHIVRYDSISIAEWYSPQNSISFADTNVFHQVKGETYVFLNKNQELALSPLDSLVKSNSFQQLNVQLYDVDGNEIGNTESLYFNTPQGISLDTYGLEEGDIFRLEIKTLDNQRHSYKGYVKRNFVNRWVINAGISGIRYELKDDGDDETRRYSMLNGITAGAYYLFDPKVPMKTRILGVGAYTNFIENSTGTDLKVTMGVGVLIKECLMIGYDLSKTKAITVGATMDILDFTKLFSN